MKQREAISLAAAAIPLDNIAEFEDEDEDSARFSVQSQTNPHHVYYVDLDVYTCDCKSYPLILFCKHIAAVQLHFDEQLEIQPLDCLFSRRAPTPSLNDTIPSTSAAAMVAAAIPNPDSAALAAIFEKLQRLTVRVQLAPPKHLTDTLRQLDTLLDHVLASSEQPRVLPKHRKVPSNQHSWPETKQVMVNAQKTKRKVLHNDPYSGGMASGKKAKTDARQPSQVRATARCV